MSTAVGYARISEKDQSNNSINNQCEGIKDYCLRNSIPLEKTFIDNGKSAFTFDRPEWINLEKYLKQHREVKYLIVYHIDRFSRATLMDALVKLNEIEVKLKVKVLSVTDPLNLDTKDLGVQLLRSINLLFSNNERNRIQERVKDGVYRSMASGRFCNMAPYGYKNSRDAENKPLIIIDENKAKAVKKIFKLYNEGMSIEAVGAIVRSEGFKLQGNSSIQRILANPLYAAIIRLPAYKGQPQKEVHAIHQPIISKIEYYNVQNKLFGKKITVQKSEDVWLRGLVHCHCGRKMTAGNSRSKSGKYYWYYKCQEHKENFSANKLHGQFKDILDNISFDETTLEFYRGNLIKSITEHQNKKGGNIMRLKLDLSKVQKKIETTQERYLLNQDIDPAVYAKVLNELKAEESRYQVEISKANTDTESMLSMMNDLLPKLTNISEVFFGWPMHQQQLFINVGFSHSLYYIDGIYRTPFIHPLFAHKALILKEKRLLEIEQSLENYGKVPYGTPDGSCIEHLEELWRVFVA